MTSSIVARLILKDLYLTRWMMAGSIVAGAVSIAMMPMSGLSGYVGGVSLICALIVLNIFLVMNGVVQERKDKVQMFLLSLPVSTAQYTAAKVGASAIAFVVPWLVLTAGAVLVIDATAMPNGILPFCLAVLGYLLAYYCVLLAVATLTDSTVWHATTITVGNISINFFIVVLMSMSSVSANRNHPTAVWTGDLLSIIAVEIAAGAAAIGIALYLRSRRPDFV